MKRHIDESIKSGYNDNPEIEDIVKMLDTFANSSESRLKIDFSDEIVKGKSRKLHHHGRCDIGSPFACGTVLNE